MATELDLLRWQAIAENHSITAYLSESRDKLHIRIPYTIKRYHGVSVKTVATYRELMVALGY